MDISLDQVDLLIIVGATIIISLLEIKLQWLRLGKLHRGIFWQDLIINLVVISLFYVLLTAFL